jgi:MoaA/NifB/PqqE/SkfB family radical SAM enzyme
MRLNVASYTAAGTLPAKIIRKAQSVYSAGRLHPVHVQISPTNVCQLDCSFCSCANRASSVEMPLADYLGIMGVFAKAGCRAVTITGGGEPTLHKDINGILLGTHAMGVKAGLVTNGLSLDRVSSDALQTLTWARISFSDDRKYDGAFAATVLDAVGRADIDWAFSYVVTQDVNYHNIAAIIGLANQLGFTHVRLVTDLLNIHKVPQMSSIKWRLGQMGVDDSRVIYQGRKAFATGRKACMTSLVKPVISADGGWYPCCGVQYALEEHGLDFEASDRKSVV